MVNAGDMSSQLLPKTYSVSARISTVPTRSYWLCEYASAQVRIISPNQAVCQTNWLHLRTPGSRALRPQSRRSFRAASLDVAVADCRLEYISGSEPTTQPLVAP